MAEPETIGDVFLLQQGTLVALKRERGNVRTKVKLGGFAGAVTIAEIKGDRAPLRLKAEDKMEFIIQLPNGVDPSKVEFYSFESREDKRVVVLAKAGTMGRDIGQNHMGQLPFDVRRYGQNSYKLTPKQALPPGEYGWVAQGEDAHTFGVDPQ